MGRHSTHPEVTDLGSFYWHLTRVLDPDDEFAQTQVLTEDGWVDYNDPSTLEDYDVLSFGRNREAKQALVTYALGYLDAADRVTVRELGT